MTERPIIFSGPMVRAILAGKKRQTRRVIKPQPPCQPEVGMYAPIGIDRHGEMYPKPEIFGAWCDDWGAKCPYGQPGDVLWVKEAHVLCNPTGAQLKGSRIVTAPDGTEVEVLYRADAPVLSQNILELSHGGLRWRPSIHMPRWASRLRLPLKSVRVERVQDISRADMAAEGWPGDDVERAKAEAGLDCDDDCIEWFAALWDSINGKTYPWASNPRVWVLEFEVQA